jgi:hypothetical protein
MVTLIAIFVLILPDAISAQSFWLEHSQGKTFLLEIFKPQVHEGVYNGVRYPVEYSFETVALFLSLRQPIGSKYFLVVELPFAHAAFDTKIDRAFSFYRHSGRSSTIGNPYLGLELGNLSFKLGSINSQFFTEVGIRLPLAKTVNNYAARVGEAVDFDRDEAFEERYVAVKAMLNFRLKHKTGLTFRIRGGAIIQRDLDHLRDHYLSLLGNAQIGYETARINIGGNFVLRVLFSRISGSDFNWEGAGALGLTASIKLGNLRPGIYIAQSAPFDSELIESFGLNLGIQP